MLEKIRVSLFRKSLRRALSEQKRRRNTYTLKNARTVGILFDATQEKNRREVLDFVQTLQKEGKKVRLLGFFDLKKQPEEKYDFDFFTLKETSWIQEPKHEKALAFAQEKFDLLLSLNPDNRLPLQWLAVRSGAAMKVGMSTIFPHDFDFIVETPANKGIRFFVEQMKFYLDKLVLTRHEPAAAL